MRSLTLNPPTLFISEYLTCGAMLSESSAGGLPESLWAEGLLMLKAVIDDFLALGWRVRTTLDARVDAFNEPTPLLDVSRVESAAQEANLFEELAAQATAVIVIAPEFHQLLRDRVRIVEQLGTTSHQGCSSSAIELCGDKLELARLLTARGIPTIPTQPLDVEHPDLAFPFPIVVKPRHGAGSTLTFRVDTDFELQQACDEIRASGEAFEFVQQPFIRGRSLAMSAIRNQLLPLTEQVLSDDKRFHYLGTNLLYQDENTPIAAASRALLTDCQAVIDGLAGYVGFDLIEPADSPGRLVLVEINPRFTSSYLAYRAACETNLAAALLSDYMILKWRADDVQFRV